MACNNLRDVAIIAIPSNLTETTLPVSNCSYIAPSGNIQLSREASFTGYVPETSYMTGYNEDVKIKNKDWGVKVKDKGLSSDYSYTDENMIVPVGYTEDLKVKNKGWGTKVKSEGFSPEYSYSTTSAMPLNQGMANTELVSTSGLCRVYQDGNTIISKCPATNCATNCNIATPTTGTNIEREATFLGYFPKTCDNLTPAAVPAPEPVPEPVMEQNLEPAVEMAPAPMEESCHHGCGRHKVKHRCNSCNAY